MFAANSFLGNGFSSFGGYQTSGYQTAAPAYNVGNIYGAATAAPTVSYGAGVNYGATYGVPQVAGYGNAAAYGNAAYGNAAYGNTAAFATNGYSNGYPTTAAGYGDYSPYSVYGGNVAGLTQGATIYNAGINAINTVQTPYNAYGLAGVQNPNAGFKPTIKPPKVNATAPLTSPERVERLLEGAFSKLEALGNQIRNAAVEFDELRTEVVSANNICDSELRTQLQEANDEIERLRSQLAESAARKAAARQAQLVPQVLMAQEPIVVDEQALEVVEEELEPVVVAELQ